MEPGHDHVGEVADCVTEDRTAYLDAMELMRSVGDVAAVTRWLRHPEILALESDNARVAACREWLVGAELHERDNGPGSLIDRSHPFWVGTLEPGLRRASQILQRGMDPLLVTA